MTKSHLSQVYKSGGYHECTGGRVCSLNQEDIISTLGDAMIKCSLNVINLRTVNVQGAVLDGP